MQRAGEQGGSGSPGLQHDPLVGAVLHESYRLVRKIGDGGMGSVYEAAHVRLSKKRFAVKILNPSLGTGEVYARFRREAEIATELRHPNIVDVMDFNTTAEGSPYMVMEYLAGEDLGSRLKRVGLLSATEVTGLIEQVGSALQAAHFRGIVHRDMKPENIFVLSLPPERMQVKILDFGISKIRDSKTVLTQHNAVFGTPHYMSPEQAEGAVEDIDHTTDIFAVGAICYQSLCGALPFDAPTIPGVLYRVCHAEPAPLSDLMPGLPEELDQVLARAMAKNKHHRYQRIDDFVKELKAVLSVVPSGLVPGTPARQPQQPQPRPQQPRPQQPRPQQPRPQQPRPQQPQPQQPQPQQPQPQQPQPQLQTPHRPVLVAPGLQPAGSSELARGLDDVPTAQSHALPVVEAGRADQGSAHHGAQRGSPGTSAVPAVWPTPNTLAEAAGEGVVAAPGSGRRWAVMGALLAGLLAVAVVGILVLRGHDRDGEATVAAAAVDTPSTGSDGAAISSPVDHGGRDAVAVTATVDAAGAIDTAVAAAPAVGRPDPRATRTTEPSTVSLRLARVPAGARVTLDGKLRSDNPLLLARDEARTHRLRVEAEGYLPAEQRVKADRDQVIEIALTKARASEQVSPKQTRGTASKRRTKRRIETRLRFDDL